MPLFGRTKPAGQPASTTDTTTAAQRDSLHKTTGRHRRAGPRLGEAYGRRLTLGQWIRYYWTDLATIAAMGIVGLGVYTASPAPSRSFPITFRDGEIVYPEFAYPLRKEIVPIWAAALLAFFVPFFFFIVMQFKYRSFFDFNNATFGLLYSLVTAAVFQVFIKWLIGGLRPHFLAVCQPSIPGDAGASGNGYLQVMYDRSVCTGDEKKINDSLESMPSGHSTAAWAGFMFLTLYFNSHLKLLSDRRPRYWKMILTFAPMLGAFLISGALTIDEFHNWYDVLVGGIIGSVTAFAAYRTHFAAIFDFRFNDIPLLPDLHGSEAPGFEYASNQGIPGDAIKGGVSSGRGTGVTTGTGAQGAAQTGTRTAARGAGDDYDATTAGNAESVAGTKGGGGAVGAQGDDIV